MPYGIYDITDNSGWVNVGIDHDTASFAVESILGWWREMGQSRYPQANSLLITADCGGLTVEQQTSIYPLAEVVMASLPCRASPQQDVAVPASRG